MLGAGPSVAALTFGPYTLIERIGIGARSEVYRARKTSDSSGQLVALKRVLAGAAHDRETQLMLSAEAELLKTLGHAGVVRVFDDGIVSGVAYVVYELVEGEDLEKVLSKTRKLAKPLPLEFAFSVATQLLSALAYVHTVHAPYGGTAASKLNAPGTTIIHRDVCPSNVLVSRKGEVRLADFGIAKVPGRNTTTGVGEIKGTIRYMSPEQVRGVPLDPRSDLYSVGAVLLELFGGPALFADQKPLDILQKLAGGAPAWNDRDPILGLPAEILTILRKVLAKNPAERYDTAAQVLEALSGVAEKLSVSASPSAIARTMADLFRDEQGTEVEESRIMADEKGGSDLDVFEGLAKKSVRPSSLPGGPTSVAAPKSTATPLPIPPPTSIRAGVHVSTLVGVAVPVLPPPAGSQVSGLPPPPSLKPQQRTAQGLAPSPGADPPRATPLPPPPPPTKGALSSDRPPISKAPNTLVAAVPPPPLSIGSAVGLPSVKAPATTKNEPKDDDKEEKTPPKGTAKAKGLDMDWEDDEESTHVFENQKHGLGRTKKSTTNDIGPASKVGAAAALLASSGGAAAARPSSLPIPSAPPAPVPPPAALPRLSDVPAPPPVPVAAQQQQQRDYRIDAAPVSRRREGSSGKIALGLAALAMVAIVGLAVYMFIPRTGQLKIDVKLKSGAPITTATVYVDGVKVCDTAPCLVNKVEGGSRAVKVVVGDFVVSENAAVEPGKERSLFLTIDDGGKEKPVVASTASATPTAVPPPEGTGIKVKAPAGVKLLVDGKERGAFDGKEIALTDLAAGEHKIKLEGGEAYESIEKTITVSKNAITDMGELKPKVLKGKLSLELKTDGALVTLSGKQDGKTFQKEFKDDNWAKQPLVLKNLDPKGELKITAKKKGFADLVETITFPDGEAEKTIVIDLTSDKPVAPTNPTNTSTVPTNTATGPTNTATATTAPASGPATITMNSIPASKVVLDGKPMGNTPQTASVTPGTHSVMFIHPEKGRKSVSVTVKAGEKKPVSVKF